MSDITMRKQILLFCMLVAGMAAYAQVPQRVPGTTGFNAEAAYQVDQYLYYAKADSGEMWRTNGTNAEKVFSYRDLYLGWGSPSAPTGFVKAGGKIFFAFQKNTDTAGLYTFDHVNKTPVLVKDFIGIPFADAIGYHYLRGMGEYNGKLYFAAQDYYGGIPANNKGVELWVSDGTTAGTKMFMDFLPGSFGFYSSSNPQGFFTFGGKLYFSALKWTGSGQNYTYVLYESDGTEAGTQPWNFGSLSLSTTAQNNYANGRFGFKILNGNLYIVDESTVNPMLTAIYRVNPSGGIIYGNVFYKLTDFSWINNKIVVCGIPETKGPTDADGDELYTYDENLSTASMSLVKNINPTTQTGCGAYGMEAIGGKLYFLAMDGGPELTQLFSTDLTAAGTVKLTNHPYYNTNLNFVDWARYQDKIYYAVYDSLTGNEVHRYDPATNTFDTWDINPGFEMPQVPRSGFMGNYGMGFYQAGGVLYFNGNDTTNGVSIWKFGTGSTGITEKAGTAAPVLYPNPAKDRVWIGQEHVADQLVLTALSGQVFQLEPQADGSFSVNGLTTGLYLYQAYHKGKPSVKGKLLVE